MNEEADLEKPETIVINADYMHLQDLGSAAYTEFDNDEDIVDLYVENEDLMNYRCGLVHSHHTMSAFFSGTDQEELHEKAENGLYLSLIVNNHMEPVAKIAWAGQIERKIETYSSWQWGHFMRDKKKQTKTELATIYYEINLDIEFDPIIEKAQLRHDELREEEDIRKEAQKARWSGGGFGGRGWSGGQQVSFLGPKDEFGAKGVSDETRTKVGKASDEFKKAVDNQPSFLDTLEAQSLKNKAFAAILMRDGNTDELGFHGASTEVMDEIRSMALTDAEENETYSEAYQRCTEEVVLEMLSEAPDNLAEVIGDFYVSEDEAMEVLEALLKHIDGMRGIFIEKLKEGIKTMIVVQDEEGQ